MSDDLSNDKSGGGFDDWLDDDPGPATDPTAANAPDAGGPDDSLLAAESDVETAEVEVVSDDDDSDGESDVDTAEVEVVSDDDDSDDDTGELDLVAPPTGNAVEDETSNTGATTSPPLAATFGGLWSRSQTVEESVEDGGENEAAHGSFDVTEADYLQAATREHEDLAEMVALAEEEDTELAAVTATIPGLDVAPVGFEDVVEAEGHGKVRAMARGDLAARIVTAIVLVAALGASLLWKPALVVFVLAVFVLGAGEFYTALVRSGRKPIALFGFLGIIGASLGAFFFGAIWIPMAFIFATTMLLLYYAVVPGRVDPVGSLALTTGVMVWVGLGSFTMLIAASDDYAALVLGIVVTVAAMDIAQYFFGRLLGRHQLSPWVSPKKTVEGLVAGIIVALTVASLLHFIAPFELTSGLAIGLAVVVFAPLGDLAMSAAKRSLGLKDMGSVLPGHGGFLDRIDGLLFVIPVAWAIFLKAGLL